MMNYTGNHMLHYIGNVLKRKIFFHFTKLFQYNCFLVVKFSPQQRGQTALLKEILRVIIFAFQNKKSRSHSDLKQ